MSYNEKLASELTSALLSAAHHRAAVEQMRAAWREIYAELEARGIPAPAKLENDYVEIVKAGELKFAAKDHSREAIGLVLLVQKVTNHLKDVSGWSKEASETAEAIQKALNSLK